MIQFTKYLQGISARCMRWLRRQLDVKVLQLCWLLKIVADETSKILIYSQTFTFCWARMVKGLISASRLDKALLAEPPTESSISLILLHQSK